jgi:hypothetical protein
MAYPQAGRKKIRYVSDIPCFYFPFINQSTFLRQFMSFTAFQLQNTLQLLQNFLWAKRLPEGCFPKNHPKQVYRQPAGRLILALQNCFQKLLSLPK